MSSRSRLMGSSGLKIVCVLQPNGEAKLTAPSPSPSPSPSPAWGILTTYLRPQASRALLLAVCLFAAIGLDLGNPQILRAFIDSAISGAALEQLGVIALAFLAVALATQSILVAETYLADNVALIATNALRADLTLHCLRLDPAFYASHTPGELIERVDGDINTPSNFFSRFVVYVVGNGLLVIGLVVLLALLDWRVALIVGGAA